MESKKCMVVFDDTTGRSTGKIFDQGEVVSELSFYLGKLHDKQPEFVEKMIRDRYAAWAKVYGIDQIEVEFRKS